MVSTSPTPPTLAADEEVVTHTFTGLLMARTTTPEHGDLPVQVLSDLRVYGNDQWFASYSDPNDPTRRFQACGQDKGGADAIRYMLAAITGIAVAARQAP